MIFRSRLSAALPPKWAALCAGAGSYSSLSTPSIQFFNTIIPAAANLSSRKFPGRRSGFPECKAKGPAACNSQTASPRQTGTQSVPLSLVSVMLPRVLVHAGQKHLPAAKLNGPKALRLVEGDNTVHGVYPYAPESGISCGFHSESSLLLICGFRRPAHNFPAKFPIRRLLD